jgi:7-keto-8-aminopelargonate synthetase-like enzyme
MTAGPVIMEGPAGPEVIIHGKKHLYFAGTGYFDLQADSRVISAANRATEKFGIGTATSRALAGTNPLLIELEEKIASFFQSEDAVFLPSGYLANLAGLKALSELGLYNVILLDNHAHYSLTDGAAAVGLPVRRFNHLDTEDLQIKLERTSAEKLRPLIATDGLFPVRAQLAPLDRYLDLAELHDGLIWVDDAHGVGILGKNGMGTKEHLGLNSSRIYMGATLSKAFGAYGGIIPGSRSFISQVKNGGLITGSTPPMNAAVAAGMKGLELVKENPEMRHKLWKNAQLLKAGLGSLGIPVDSNPLPIVAFKLESESQMIELQQNLLKERIFIQYAVYGGAGLEGVLRIVVFSTHTSLQIDSLIHSLKKYLPRVN